MCIWVDDWIGRSVFEIFGIVKAWIFDNLLNETMLSCIDCLGSYGFM